MWAIRVLVALAAMLTCLLLFRQRLGTRAVATIASAAFACAMAYSVWRVEWFDVYRHGIPSATYLLKSIVAYSVTSAIVGWVVGLGISRIPTQGRLQ